MSSDSKDTGQGIKKTPKLVDAVGQFGSYFANDHHIYAARKAERLASAVHVVTSFMGPQEPLRTMLRTSALELVQLITDSSRLGNNGPDTIGARCAEIGSMLDTAQVAGLASSMNAKLILDEYAHLANFVRDRYALIRARSQDISDTVPPTTPLLYKGQKDINTYRTQQRTSISDRIQTSSRRDEILSLLNTKERISIKDASLTIPGVSEKTLQRELLSMVSDGVLIKEGERRWSTYRKAPQAA